MMQNLSVKEMTMNLMDETRIVEANLVLCTRAFHHAKIKRDNAKTKLSQREFVEPVVLS